MKRRQKRALQRRYAIIGVLCKRGSMSETGICLELGIPLGTIYPDLQLLEEQGYIIPQWVEGPYPRHRVYKLENE